MHIETRYGFGDKVWTFWLSSEPVELPCRFCRGARTMSVTGAGGERNVPCPDCGGRGAIRMVSVPVWKVQSKPLTVAQVRVELTQSRGAPDVSQADNYKPQQGREERYMCEETGVGTGSLHAVDHLFPSRGDAELEAERLSAEIAAGEANWKPPWDAACAAKGFLDHRDVYEYEPEHVALAERLVAAYGAPLA